MTVDEFVAQWSPHFGAGWTPLLRILARYFESNDPECLAASTFKEKFGGLRSELRGVTRTITWEFATAVEDLSHYLCEECGQEARTNTETRAWYKTLCPAHWTIPQITSYPPRKEAPKS